ncbi:hypothetical protein Tco_1065791 [Tanacetum coccineum]
MYCRVRCSTHTSITTTISIITFIIPTPRIPSPPLLLPPNRPLHTSPTYARALLGYKAAMVQLRAALPSTYHPLMPSEIPSPPLPLPPLNRKDAIPESHKRTCFTALSHRFEIEERSAAAAAARQTGFALARGVDYGFIDIWMYDSEEFNTRHQDAHDDRALLQARISTLEREIKAMEAHIRALHAELERTRDAKRKDRAADASSSC